MAKFLTLVLAVICGSLGTTAYGEESRSVTIKIENQSGTKFDAYKHEFLQPAKAFTPTVQNVVESKIQLSADWFSYVDVRIVGKAKTNSAGEDLEHWVRLRIRRDSQPEFTIPIYFGDDRTNYEMDRLERKKNINEQSEKFFRMYQIAYYYRGKNQGGFQRAAQAAFFAAVDLAEYNPYVILLSDEAEELVKEALPGKTSIFLARANLARSAYWNDLPLVQEYAAKGDCDTAKLILKAYQELKTRELNIFDISKNHPDVLKHITVKIVPKCGQSLADSAAAK